MVTCAPPLRSLRKDTGLAPLLLRRCMNALQALEPAGVGAQSLKQCLRLQLERTGSDETALRIVQDFLPSLAKVATGRLLKQRCPRKGSPAAHRTPSANWNPAPVSPSADRNIALRYARTSTSWIAAVPLSAMRTVFIVPPFTSMSTTASCISPQKTLN